MCCYKAFKYNRLNLPVISILKLSILIFQKLVIFQRAMNVFEFQLVSVIVFRIIALKREVDFLLKDPTEMYKFNTIIFPMCKYFDLSNIRYHLHLLYMSFSFIIKMNLLQILKS